MNFTKCNKNFVSEIDQFLAEFDKRHPQQSPSQQYEIKKYERIARLRDQAEVESTPKDIWEGF